MKKVLMFAAAAFVASTMFTSCKKCSTCKYTYDSAGTSMTYTYPEYCGKKKDVESYESACKTAAALYTSGSCSCN